MLGEEVRTSLKSSGMNPMNDHESEIRGFTRKTRNLRRRKTRNLSFLRYAKYYTNTAHALTEVIKYIHYGRHVPHCLKWQIVAKVGYSVQLPLPSWYC